MSSTFDEAKQRVKESQSDVFDLQPGQLPDLHLCSTDDWSHPCVIIHAMDSEASRQSRGFTSPNYDSIPSHHGPLLAVTGHYKGSTALAVYSIFSSSVWRRSIN